MAKKGKSTPKPCKPSKYNVILSDRQTITYGFRCAQHKIHSKRYKTEELRDQRHDEHIAEALGS